MSGAKDGADLLDPRFLARLERMDLRIRRLKAGVHRGDVETARLGAGTLFREHRAYVPGDDPRFLDWNAYMRSGQLHVKRFQGEERPRILVLLDGSASMGIHGGRKWKLGSRIAAGLMALSLLRHAVAGLRIFPGGAPRMFEGKGAIPGMLRRIAEFEPAGEAGFAEAARSLLHRRSASGLAFVVSDWMDTGDHPEGLAALLRRGYRVVAVRIRDDEDRRFQVRERVLLRDPETGRRERVRLDRGMIDAYLEVLDAHFRAVRSTCLRHEVPLVEAPVEEDVEQALVRIILESPWYR